MIVSALNSYYAQKGVKDTEKRYEERGGFTVGPSSLGECGRKIAWLLSGLAPEPLSPETVRTFELGHQRGEALERACKEIWPDAQSQVPVRIPLGKFTLTGTCDLWIPSLRTVVDFKTVGSFGAKMLDKESASEEYKLQMHAYREGIARMLGLEPLPISGLKAATSGIRCVLVYEAKDSPMYGYSDPTPLTERIRGGTLMELEVPWTDELEERYQARLREIEGLLIRREQGTLDPTKVPELPLGPKGGKSWKCKYCSVGESRGGCYANTGSGRSVG